NTALTSAKEGGCREFRRERGARMG
ncbi:hypothetical protein ETH_00007655, partial [Eimeria tenella]